jgi:hypothetical protein
MYLDLIIITVLCEATWCRVLAQAVRPVAAKVWLHSQTSQCGTCGGKFVLGQIYLRVSRFLLFLCLVTQCPTLIYSTTTDTV